VEVVVREWTPYNDYERPDAVNAVELGWPVPTLQKLWFGSGHEDKQKRLRAFLSCLRSDNCQPLLTQASVPQHCILLACVLRYIMTSSTPARPLLSKPELDALLATAFSPELRDPHLLAELQVETLSKRGVEIATMVVQGLEMALFCNDACGAPVPSPMCLSWTFFDGKLFQTRLQACLTARNLMEMCGGRMDVAYAVERMRAAILHGLLPPHASSAGAPVPPQSVQQAAAFRAARAAYAATAAAFSAGRGMPARPRFPPPYGPCGFHPMMRGGHWGGGPPGPGPRHAGGGFHSGQKKNKKKAQGAQNKAVVDSGPDSKEEKAVSIDRRPQEGINEED